MTVRYLLMCLFLVVAVCCVGCDSELEPQESTDGTSVTEVPTTGFGSGVQEGTDPVMDPADPTPGDNATGDLPGEESTPVETEEEDPASTEPIPVEPLPTPEEEEPTESEPAGACANQIDEDVLLENQDDLNDVMGKCAVDCLGEETCATNCVIEEIGLSQGCSECFGENIGCTLKNCFPTCMNAESPQCKNCQQDNCMADFEVCAGVSPPEE